MVKWLNFAKWLSVLYELQMFMDWNPVAMTTRGMKNELTRLVDSVQMRQVCDMTAEDEGESERQGGRLF